MVIDNETMTNPHSQVYNAEPSLDDASPSSDSTTMAYNDPEQQPLIDGGDYGKKRSRQHGTWKRFAAFVTFGISVLFIYGLIMLPRTSLSRDWRRLHNERLTRAELERTLFEAIDPQRIREHSKKYTAERHLAGENVELAEWTRQQWEDAGFKSEIVQYDVYLNQPVDHAVKLLNKDGSVKFEASLVEDKLEEDPTSNLPDDQLVPTFHGYSASGNVTGKYLYANLGRKQDYDLLVSKGVDFKDKIVIVRYGGIFRGLKVKFAQDLGAAAVLIYSDPAEDGEITEKNGYKAYPDGPARNPSSVQRGSVQFLSYGPGDPTTPGYPSNGDVERQRPEDFIPSIPSIPISYKDALPLLTQLNGKGLSAEELGKGWAGALDEYDYSVGPSELEVNVFNLQDYDIRPIYNVIGKLDGIISSEAIVLGNHRDAWIAGGAGDPNSGSAVLIELARAFGELKKKGWKPTRTIILASWDGEEYGLLGSTEWGEDHAKYIHSNVLAYLNVDVACSGNRFSASASPYLNDLFRSVVKRVASPVDPEKHDSLYAYWNHTSGARISNLGSGSDYTVFLDHLGVPSIDFGFTGSKAVYHYHSNYDSFHWIDNFVDHDWKVHEAATRVWGLTALSLAEEEVVAFKTEEYGSSLINYLQKLEPAETFKDVAGPKIEDLIVSLQEYTEAAAKYDEYTSSLAEEWHTHTPWFKLHKKIQLLVKIKVANTKLFRLERLFLHHEGLDDREWFKHIVFAPGRYTGYAGELLPGITEALEDHDEARLLKWVTITKAAVESATHLIS